MRAVQTLPLPSGYAQTGVWVLGICECVAAVCIILGLFTRVAGAGVIAITVLALAFTGMSAATVFFPLFFQLVLGVAPANSGLLTGPLMAGTLYLFTRLGHRENCARVYGKKTMVSH